MNIKKLPILSLSNLLLIALVIGGYGSAFYFWQDDNKAVDVVIVEPLATENTSTTKKPLESIKPSLSTNDSARRVSLKRTKLLNKIKLVEEEISNQESSIQLIDNTYTSADFVKEALVDNGEGSLTGIREESSTGITKEASTGTIKEPVANIVEVPSVDTIEEASAGVIKKVSTEVIERVSADYANTLSNELLENTSTESLFQSIAPETETFQAPIARSNLYVQGGLASQAELRLQSNVSYDGRYVRMSYPMGDVPSNIGVCTDVVIRSLRGLGIDLQQRVHEDMKRNFRSYPNNWQLSRPDSNIDHRRVPNLMTYFERKGASLGISSNPSDYQAGDIVAWDMGNGLTHIGIVANHVSEITSNPLIVHNIGVGPEMTDILFDFKIIGHYKYGNNSHERYVSNTY